MPLSISDPDIQITWEVMIEVMEGLILLIDNVEETMEELDVLALILKEFDNLAAIIEVWLWDLLWEVGGCLKADMALEVDEIHEEFVDLGEAFPSIKHVDREGGGGLGHDVYGLNVMHSGHVGPPGSFTFTYLSFHSTLTPVLLV